MATPNSTPTTAPLPTTVLLTLFHGQVSPLPKESPSSSCFSRQTPSPTPTPPRTNPRSPLPTGHHHHHHPPLTNKTALRMCQTVYFTPTSCSHTWTRVAVPCSLGMGFANCPHFLSASPFLASAMTTSTMAGEAASGLCRDCPVCDLDGDYDRNEVRVVYERRRRRRRRERRRVEWEEETSVGVGCCGCCFM